MNGYAVFALIFFALLLAVPCMLTFAIVTRIPGPARIMLLLILSALLAWVFYNDHACNVYSQGATDDPCEGEDIFAFSGLIFGASAAAGIIAGAIRNQFRRSGVPKNEAQSQ